MDAAPASPIADPPAQLAPGPDLPRGMAPNFSARAGFGVGGSNYGFSGAYFAQVDGWVARHLALGLEGENAGATYIQVFSKPDQQTYGALRARASLRFPIGPRAFVVTAFGVGVAALTTKHAVPDPNPYCCDDDAWFSDHSVYVARREISPTGSFELSLRWQLKRFEMGLTLRAEGTTEGAFFLVGPTFGFGL